MTHEEKVQHIEKMKTYAPLNYLQTTDEPTCPDGTYTPNTSGDFTMPPDQVCPSCGRCPTCGHTPCRYPRPFGDYPYPPHWPLPYRWECQITC